MADDSSTPKRVPPSIPPKGSRRRPTSKDARVAGRSGKPSAPKRVPPKANPAKHSASRASSEAASSARPARHARGQRSQRPDAIKPAASHRPSWADQLPPDTSRRLKQAPAGTPSRQDPPTRVSWHKVQSTPADATRVQRQAPERRQPPPSYAPKSKRATDTQPEAKRPSQAPRRQPTPSRQQRPAPQRQWAPAPARPSAPPEAPRRRKKRKHTKLLVVAVLLIALVGWPIGVLMWASGQIKHVDALTGAPNTPGTTYLLAGSDSREGTNILDDTEGRRADSIMMLHHAENGNTYMVSIPRDTWVNIPDYGESKINASYAYGGEELLVATVEDLTGLTVDHFVEIGMYGVADIVDSMGGVELCLDYDVDDPKSELVWKSGCHQADGHTALAFARMRYSDPNGDIGRAERQRQVIGSVVKTAASPRNFMNPLKQKAISGAAANAVTTDPDTSALELAQMAWYFKKATDAGMTGAPPIANINLETYMGSAVELDPYQAPEFFTKLQNGTLQKADFNQMTG